MQQNFSEGAQTPPTESYLCVKYEILKPKNQKGTPAGKRSFILIGRLFSNIPQPEEKQVRCVSVLLKETFGDHI